MDHWRALRPHSAAWLCAATSGQRGIPHKAHRTSIESNNLISVLRDKQWRAVRGARPICICTAPPFPWTNNSKALRVTGTTPRVIEPQATSTHHVSLRLPRMLGHLDTDEVGVGLCKHSKQNTSPNQNGTTEPHQSAGSQIHMNACAQFYTLIKGNF